MGVLSTVMLSRYRRAVALRRQRRGAIGDRGGNSTATPPRRAGASGAASTTAAYAPRGRGIGHWRWLPVLVVGVVLALSHAHLHHDTWGAGRNAADGTTLRGHASIDMPLDAGVHSPAPVPGYGSGDAAATSGPSGLAGLFGRRHLMSSGSDEYCTYPQHELEIGWVVLYTVALLFGLLGLAIICDDFFVASLEKISEVLDLSEDVAGATFMAAGSSAPELFTSTADVFFFESNVGIGTIVGSAVFNILVIIALSGVASSQALLIDWKPLTRDCVFYAGSIGLLVWVSSDGDIVWGEALVLIGWYLLYVAFMTQNRAVFDWIDWKLGVIKREEEELAREEARALELARSALEEEEARAQAKAQARKFEALRREARQSALKQHLRGGWHHAQGHGHELWHADKDGDKDSVQRSGSVHRGRSGSVHRGRPGSVHRGHSGGSADSDHGVRHDRRRRSSLDAAQLAAIGISSDAIGVNLDMSFKMTVRRKMRGCIYAIIIANVELPRLLRLKRERQRLWAEACLSIPRSKRHPALVRFKGAVHAVILAEITFPEAYVRLQKARELQLALEEAQRKVMDDALDAWSHGDGSHSEGGSSNASSRSGASGDDDGPQGPLDKFLAVASWPWYKMFGYTIPDCAEEKYEKYYVVTFILSILWIMGLSYVLVDMAQRIGCSLGVDPVLMGLTVLAAGTSIPDALGSMVVARDGMGNMAVSNAIGSNVFDICLGIGLPYFVKTGIVSPGSFIPIRTESVLEPIIVLFSTLVLTFLAFVVNRWYLTRSVAWGLFLLYFVFVAYSIVSAPA